MAFHPSVYLREELEARGWTRADLARAMGDPGNLVEWKINRLAVDIYFDVGPDNRAIRLGDMAAGFGRAFGTSPELWVNLENSWLETPPPAGETESS